MKLGKWTSPAAIVLLAGPIAACSGANTSQEPGPHPTTAVGPSTAPVAQANGGAATTSSAAPATRIRPALADPMQYTQHELTKHDYPPRPDPEKAPSAYQAWLKAVSRPTTLITPVLAPLTRHHTTTVFSNIWSGFMDDWPHGAYNLVAGGWTVPTVTADPNQDTSSSIWVGIDGHGTEDIWQAGTEQYAPAGGTPVYLAVFEFLPTLKPAVKVSTGQTSGGAIVNFPVNPGDEVAAAVMVGDQDQNPTDGGLYLWYIISNETQGVSTGWMGAPVAPSDVEAAYMPQSQAEWIVERPSKLTASGTVPYPLAQYGRVDFNYMAVLDDSGWQTAITDSTAQLQMLAADNRTLSAVTYNDPWSFVASFVSEQ